MIHYTCDRCHREIDTEVEVRYSVDVQVQAIQGDSQEPAIDPDADHLLDLHEMLERLDDLDDSPAPIECRSRQFDLCRDCYKVYSRNPLARDFPVTIGFSDN